MRPVYTERLYLLPLRLEQLETLRVSEKALEEDLGLHPSNLESLNDELETQAEAIPAWIEKVKKFPSEYPWFTNWMIISKTEHKALGAINLTRMGAKDEQLLIGYQIKSNYRRKGYAREALEGIRRWAFSDNRIQVLLAETEKQNSPSESLLKSAGFDFMFEQNGVNIWACPRSF